MSEGVVKWFDSKKGYGFIQQEEGPDLFVHFSSVKMDGYKSLEEGQKVNFDITDKEKGPTATNVTLV